ncbi:MAG: hypothetical protein A2Y84_00335 [Candidatus Colwellbacteria bacterium RBG_13_48_8]|uniref:Asp/Glu-ADT subunit C n=1 Tax=Candidatus Colwellbacteria bacterium RBG_13_48_8 TaxID=1797685 RepID=A0A1G1YXL4_9BACT|nr:MAG: hypothetical protein A2Y84_00335 [Candidatus Colwellbacteria bacterium RBG_13_48_8]
MDFDIRKYAHLARIRLTEEEVKQYQQNIEEILNHVEELKKVDVKNVAPVTGGTELRNVSRGDEESGERADFEPRFPAGKNDYLKVPKVFNHD